MRVIHSTQLKTIKIIHNTYKYFMIHVNKPLHWLRMLYCIILLHRDDHNTLGSKKMCLMFLPCEVGLFSSALPVLVAHVIQLRINPLVNPPGRLLTVNVWDVICIWARYGEIISPLRNEPELSTRALSTLTKILADVGTPWSSS
jgi:hypothetical protein